MELIDANLDWIVRIIGGQNGCLKDFCIYLFEREKNQINKLVVPPIPKGSAFFMPYETV